MLAKIINATISTVMKQHDNTIPSILFGVVFVVTFKISQFIISSTFPSFNSFNKFAIAGIAAALLTGMLVRYLFPHFFIRK